MKKEQLTPTQEKALSLLTFDYGMFLRPQWNIRLDTWAALIRKGYISVQLADEKGPGPDWYAGPEWTAKSAERAAYLRYRNNLAS